MSVVVDGEGERLLICKGAVDEVYAACTTGEGDRRTFPLDASHERELRVVSNALNEDGFRVIAIAYKRVPREQHAFGVGDERALTLLGYIAFLDPPKESAGPALRAIGQKGVAVKILTGDNPVVTRKICRDVGLPVKALVEGAALDPLSDDELAAVASASDVFARVSPAQKARIIGCLQRAGHVVGFLGDGINDGPALKAADVGISVDTAVDIAKESADIILLEKSLLILEQGIAEGRKVFANIVKYIRMGASSNFGNMLSVVGASAWLPFLPMAPIQVLTTNLLYDVSQTAIPTDNVDDDFLARPRRWEIGSLGRYILWMGPVSSLFDYATFLTLYYVLGASTVAQQTLFQTTWFVESLLSQALVIHVIRTTRIPFFESRAGTPLILTTLAVCAMTIWLPWSPLAGPLGFAPLPAVVWPYLAGIVAAYLLSTYWIRGWLLRRMRID
jgi:Mg2+-importing ATPase